MRMSATADELRRLPLHDLHVRRGGEMVPFAGYEMPLQYAPGVLKEHLHTRAAAGLFDVSHMGQIILRPRNGNLVNAALALETLVPMDIASLKPGRQRYALFTTETGEIADDLMVANLGTHLVLIVNATCKVSDEAHLRERLSNVCEVSMLSDRVLLALQGPQACAALASLAPSVESMRFMDAVTHQIDGTPCLVTRSGYTGEDGFEVSIPREVAASVAEQLLVNPHVHLIGLGARDSLRLEAGLCLYGNDISLSTSPVEAALEWAIQSSRRAQGSRAGGFPGAAAILGQLERGAARRRIGLRSESRPVRAGAQLFLSESATTPVGSVTSGGFGPSVNGPVAMGYLPIRFSQAGNRLFADVRGHRVPVTVSDMPFIRHSYKR
jgi:aminomethyltransferase